MSNSANANEENFNVILSDDALFVFTRIPTDTEYSVVDSTLELLQSSPYLGRIYDPLYEAARPPFVMRVVYAGRYGIYYEVIENRKEVDILFIEDQRRNPNERFSDIELFYG